MPSLFDDDRNSLLNDELNRDRDDMMDVLDRAIDDSNERMEREKDHPEPDREIEIDKGLLEIRDQALRDIDDRDKNGGQGRADSQGAFIGAMSHR